LPGNAPAAPSLAPKPATPAQPEPLSAKQEMPLAFAPSKPAQPPQEVEETAVPQASPEATREKVHVSAAARPAPTAQPKLLAQEAPPPTTEKVREDALEFFAPRPSSAPTAPEKPAEAEGAYRQAAEIPEEIGSQALRHADAVPGEATPPLPVASGAKRAGMPSKTEVGGPTHESALSLGRSAAKETEKPRGPANTARQLVDEGEAFMNQGKTDAAVKSYRDGLRLEPSSVDIRTRLGLALSKQGKSKEAVRYFTEAIRIDPKNVAAHLYLGDEYAKTGQLDKAIAHYNQVLEIDPANKYALLNLGSALETLGRHEEAMDRLKNALAIDRAFTAAQELLDRIIAEHGTGAPSADQGPH